MRNMTCVLLLAAVLATAAPGSARQDEGGGGVPQQGEHPVDGPVLDGQKNPFAAVRSAVEEGESIFAERCAFCHGRGGVGRIGPDLTDRVWAHGDSDAEIYRSISHGIPGSTMPRWGGVLSREQIWKLISYLRSLSEP